MNHSNYSRSPLSFPVRDAEEKSKERLRRASGRETATGHWLLLLLLRLVKNKEAGDGAKGRRENKDIVSGPAIRDAKFIRKALIAKN